MKKSKCHYCCKYYVASFERDKCEMCDKQFKIIGDNILKKYLKVIKKQTDNQYYQN